MPHDRFLRLDRDRAQREWARYEGTPQRDLFRQLRERFLERHAVRAGWCVDLGSGPGRFSSQIGGPGAHHVALDLSRNMLTLGQELERRRGSAPPLVHRVRGDAGHPPFAPASLSEIALLGNALGFEIDRGAELLTAVEKTLAPGGTLVVEIAPGPGERSRYLSRLPPGAVRRLLAAPLAAIVPRVLREGFEREPVRHRTEAFVRWTPSQLERRWAERGWQCRETLAVAPALGPREETLRAVAGDPKAWGRLLELEEELGRRPERWTEAAAVLVAAGRPSSAQTI